MNNVVCGKTMKNGGKHRIIKLLTTERRTNYLVSETCRIIILQSFLQKSVSNRNEKQI